MTHLTKEIRADYTGKLVTRTVKVDSGTSTAKSLPSPVLASKSEAALEEEYRLTHKAPYADEEGYYPSIDNISQLMGDDVYTNPEWFAGDGVPDHEALATLRAVRGNPDAMVNIYRSVPKGVKDINAGDWVSTSRKYAEAHGNGIAKSGEFDLLVAEVPARTLFSEGNSLEEFGYDGEGIKTQRKSYREMTVDEKREYIPDLMHRAQEANSIIHEEMMKNPTIEGVKELFEKHKDIIHESHQYAMFEPSFHTVGYDFDSYINERLEEEGTAPQQLGGVRIRLVANGKDKTVELYGDDSPNGNGVDQVELMTQAVRKLRIKSNYDLTRIVNEAELRADVSGSGAKGIFNYGTTYNIEDYSVQYAEVTLLPSRSEEFITQHGGTAAVAEGWL